MTKPLRPKPPLKATTVEFRPDHVEIGFWFPTRRLGPQYHGVRVPYADVPALAAATNEQRQRWRWIEYGRGVEWPALGVRLMADEL